MTDPTLPLSISPPTRRRGRPPGAKSKRSLDLARYIEATFAGSTPGQQAAQLAMVTPRELREAKAAAKDLRILDHGLDPLTLAMVVKAHRLAASIGCETRDAWLLIQKEREALMAYVHQKQAPKADTKPDARLAHVFLVQDGPDQPALADFTTPDAEALEFLDDPSDGPDQVA